MEILRKLASTSTLGGCQLRRYRTVYSIHQEVFRVITLKLLLPMQLSYLVCPFRYLLMFDGGS